MKLTIKEKRQKVKHRIIKTVKGSPERPRLSVFRSNTSIYCQLIDDTTGTTLFAASSKDKSVGKASKSEQAKKVGELIASKAKTNNISSVVFDRNGFLYHGRVKQLAEGAREGGLNF